jgi:hypothetical protein
MRKLQRRLDALERRLMPRGANPLVLEIRGGLNDDEPTFARAGAMHWERAPSELYTAFCERVVAEATAAGERLVLIGGLPLDDASPDDCSAPVPTSV